MLLVYDLNLLMREQNFLGCFSSSASHNTIVLLNLWFSLPFPHEELSSGLKTA